MHLQNANIVRHIQISLVSVNFELLSAVCLDGASMVYPLNRGRIGLCKRIQILLSEKLHTINRIFRNASNTVSVTCEIFPITYIPANIAGVNDIITRVIL